MRLGFFFWLGERGARLGWLFARLTWRPAQQGPADTAVEPTRLPTFPEPTPGSLNAVRLAAGLALIDHPLCDWPLQLPSAARPLTPARLAATFRPLSARASDEGFRPKEFANDC